MYYIQFFRTCANFLDDKKFVFQRASGYGVCIDDIEYAIARSMESPKEWDITEVSTGLSLDIDGEHKVFPTREAALKWLKKFAEDNNIAARLKKHSDVKEALDVYSEPYKVRKKQRKPTGKITLTPKQKDFLEQYAAVIGADSCETREVARELGVNPSLAGAMISTLVEKGVFETFVDKNTKYMELTEAGIKIMEVING